MKAADDIRVVLPKRAKRAANRVKRERLMQDAHVRQFKDARRAPLAARALADAIAAINARRAMTGATGAPETLRSIPKLVQARKVDNPELTVAQANAVWEQELTRAEGERREANVEINRIWADENALSRIGALAYIRKPRRKLHHEQAAERFKSLYEARYGSAGGAVDPSNEPVDTSSRAHDAGMAARIDATSELLKVEDRLRGHEAIYSRLVGHVVLGVPCSYYCRTTPSGQTNKRDEAKAVKWLLMSLELVAAIWGMRPLPA